MIDLDHLARSLGFVRASPTFCMAVEDAQFSISGAALVEGGRPDVFASDPFIEDSADVSWSNTY